ncbi:MAG: hypothetical protein JXP34_27445, partial [Planctomycetes bacterium]|nr:hypothetical protein [Planctomycetota bacterium]
EPRPCDPTVGHAWDPEGLLGLAREIYGRAPRAVLVGLGARSFELGGAPDPAAVERGIALVRELASRGGDGPGGAGSGFRRSFS